jgi:hypothetical protein
MTDSSTRFLKDKKALLDRHQALLDFGTFLSHVLYLIFDREDRVFRLGNITLGLQIEDGPPCIRIPPPISGSVSKMTATGDAWRVRVRVRTRLGATSAARDPLRYWCRCSSSISLLPRCSNRPLLSSLGELTGDIVALLLTGVEVAFQRRLSSMARPRVCSTCDLFVAAIGVVWPYDLCIPNGIVLIGPWR